jgi:hypothetical protein
MPGKGEGIAGWEEGEREKGKGERVGCLAADQWVEAVKMEKQI